MTAALLDAVGLSTGSFTSPNLERVQERMAWRGEPIPDEALAEVLTRVAAVEEFLADRPSYFEILTAAAFDWFADVAVDVAVVEVGLGGTWDATNILRSPVSVVTNVSVDHVEYLGGTREEIARGEVRHRAGGIHAGPRGDRPRALRDLRGSPARSDRAARPRLRCPLAAAGARWTCARPQDAGRHLRRSVSSAPWRAPSRQRGDRAHGRRDLSRRDASPTISSPKRLPAWSRPAGWRSSAINRSSCSTARTTSPARTRCFVR